MFGDMSNAVVSVACVHVCAGLPPEHGLDQFDEYKATDCMLGQADYTQPLLQYNDDGTLKESLTLISCMYIMT